MSAVMPTETGTPHGEAPVYAIVVLDEAESPAEVVIVFPTAVDAELHALFDDRIASWRVTPARFLTTRPPT